MKKYVGILEKNGDLIEMVLKPYTFLKRCLWPLKTGVWGEKLRIAPQRVLFSA